MRIAQLIFTGSIAALAVLMAPALAKSSHTQKVDDTSASSASPTCRAYQQAPDGSWTSLPCQENGSAPQAPTQPKSAARGPAEEDAR